MEFPIEALDTHAAIIGRTGSGKTYAAKGMVERLIDMGRRCVIIDPTGAWWGLRSTAGGGKGLPIAILGGRHGDIPLADTGKDGEAGEILGRFLAKHSLSAVIDLSEYSLAGQRRFATAFAESLYQDTRSTLHLVIDEADEFAPQKPRPETAVMLNRFDRIVRRGRSRGFRVMMITQRPAVLNKDLLSQAGCLVVMKITNPNDRKAIGAWIEGNADHVAGRKVLDALAGLKAGDGFVWWPDGGTLDRMTFPPLRTFDSSAAPADGSVETAALSPPPASLDALREAIGRKAPSAPKATQADAQAIKAAYDRGHAEGVAAALALQREFEAFFRKCGEALLADLGEFVRQPFGKLPTPAAPSPRDVQKFQAEIERQPIPRLQPGEPLLAIGPERRILNVLAARHPARFTDAQWATLAGMRRTGGTWRTYVSRLRTRGLIFAIDGLFGVSEAGLALADRTPPEGSPLDQWKASLGAGPAKMLDALIDRLDGLDAVDLAAAVGMEPKGGTFRTYLSRLSSNGLIERRDGFVRLAEILRQ